MDAIGLMVNVDKEAIANRRWRDNLMKYCAIVTSVFNVRNVYSGIC